MKILLIEICNFVDYPTGGHLSFARNMLAAFGHELALVGCTTDETTPVGCWTKKEIQGVQYDFFAVRRQTKSSRRPLIPARLSGFLHLLRQRKQVLSRPYDMIFIQTPEVLFALPRKVYPKCCLRMPGVNNPLSCSRYRWSSRMAPLYNRVFQRQVRGIPCILATAGKMEIEEFIRNNAGWIDPENVAQYPTRYDDAIYHPAGKNEARKKLKIPEREVMIVTVGRLAEFKGWRLMLDAFQIFHRQFPESVFYFIGDGEDQEKIQSYVRKLSLQDAVRLAGRKVPEEIAGYLQSADLFIMGSVAEGWSTTLLEACACACPVVTTLFSSSPDMVENGKNGFIVSRNPAEFAEKMQEALTLPREFIQSWNRRFDSLAVRNMRDSLLSLKNVLRILKGTCL